MKKRQNKRYILGVHSGHDASACLFRDVELCGAIEKERLTRVKHDSGEPIECIEYLLSMEKISYEDVDLVIRCNWYNAKELNDEYYKNFKRVLVDKNHHLFHAYAVSLLTQDKDSIICVFDGHGCRPRDANLNGDDDTLEAESIYLVHNNHIICLEKYFSHYFCKKYKWGSHINSLGYAFANVSRCIFQSHDAAGKVMALAAYGHISESMPPICVDLTRVPYTVNPVWLDHLNSCSIPISYKNDFAKAISRAVQESTEKYCFHRINNLIMKYKINSISLSGGFALNCKNNGNLFNNLPIMDLNIFPACGDNGLSIGAAVWAIRNQYNDYQVLKYTTFLEKKYRETRFYKSTIAESVELLKHKKIIGLFDLGSEFGPRALCHRSILADPTFPDMKDILNSKKGREAFRPFGGVILERNIGLLTEDRIPNDWMLVAVNVKKDIASKIPSLPHYDGTIRVQVIRDTTSFIYALLSQYEKTTGRFILINTSFNLHNEPIVETENQARRTAQKMGLDYLIVGGKGEIIN